MADTFSTNLNLTKPEVGSSTDTWGTKLNTQVIDPIDAVFSATGTEVNVRFNSANFDDNKKALFGTGDDLEIYHDGNNSYIKEAGTGNLKINADSLHIKNASDNELKAYFDTNGAVALYHDNQQKFVTSSSGVSISGNIAVTGTVDGVDISALNSSLATVATSGSYNDLSNTPTIPTNNNQLSNGSNYTTFNSNQATDTSSSVTFSRVSINGGSSIRLATGSWDGESDGKIQRHSTHMYFQTPDAGAFIFRNQSGSDVCTIEASNGELTSSNNITAYSDVRLKKDVKTIENALDKVSKLRGVEYTRKSNDEREIGVIAQEVKEIVPELVSIKESDNSLSNDGLKDIHTMKYQNTVGLLIEAIKELKAEINELKGA